MEFNPAVLQHVCSKIQTTGFDSFIFCEGVNPLLFFHLCIFHYSDVQKNKTLKTSEVMSQHIKVSKSPKTDDLSKKDPLNFRGKDGAIGQVTIGPKQNPIVSPVIQLLLCQGRPLKYHPNYLPS